MVRGIRKTQALLVVFAVATLALHLMSCGGGAGTTTGSGGAIQATSGTTGAKTAMAAGPVGVGGSGSTSTGIFMTGVGGSVGDWTDGPGSCPTGMPQVDITTATDLAAAAAGTAPHDTDAPATCYLIHSNTYAGNAGATLQLSFAKGGVPGGARRVFVGDDRNNVSLHAAVQVMDGTSDLTISNLTVEPVVPPASSAVVLGNGKNITLDHVTITPGSDQAHVDARGSSSVLMEECLVEGSTGDGIRLTSGSDLTVRNSILRGNGSGIDLNTQGGATNTLDKITIEQTRITNSALDGISIIANATGPATNVTIRRSIVDQNASSGISFRGGGESGVTVTNDTFYNNGLKDPNGSDIKIYSATGDATGTMMSKNLFKVGTALINDCYDAASHGFGLSGDFVDGVLPTGAQGNCVMNETVGLASFANAGSSDFHPMNPDAQSYGAYAP